MYGDLPYSSTHDVVIVEPGLTGSVKCTIIAHVVISLEQDPNSNAKLLVTFVRSLISGRGTSDRCSWILIARWTIGISRPSILKTTISPVRMGAVPIWRKRMSPRWNPGSMLPLKTTTTGDSLPVIRINVFHMISAEVTIKPGTWCMLGWDARKMYLPRFIPWVRN